MASPKNQNEPTTSRRSLFPFLKRTYPGAIPENASDTAKFNPYQAALDGAGTEDKNQSLPTEGRGTMYRENLALSELKPGECGYILRLNGTFCGRLRLLEMGLTPGTHVKLVRAAAFGGPLDIEVRGYQLSLRREEAASVWLGEEVDE